MLAELIVAASLAAPPALPPRIETGRSVEGRRIVAVRRGRSDAPVRVLVSGSTHGTEPAGHAVIRRLRQLAPPGGVQVWTVRTFNPDGAVRGTRQNARGVDLNRNFPFRWRSSGRPFDTYHPGPGPASEPETRAQMRLIERIRPQISIHFHQALRLVTLSGGARPDLQPTTPAGPAFRPAGSPPTAERRRAGRTTSSRARPRSWSSWRRAR